jgi:hypothetical protein
MQLLQPLGIGYVRLSAGHILYMARVDKAHLEAALYQDLEKWHPEYTCEPHRHGFDPAALQPVCKPMQVLGKGLERTHCLWVAINWRRYINADCTDVDSIGGLRWIVNSKQSEKGARR